MQVNGKHILLDCGLFQGRRHETHAKNLRLPLDVSRIDAVVLSHAHIDHVGRIPLLVREGYRGTIWCTAATRDLAAVMLADSAHIQEQDAEFLTRHHKDAVPPLYSLVDATRTAELMAGIPYHKRFEVTTGVHVTFVDASHILGSASVVLDFEEGGRSQSLELQDTGVDLDYVVVGTEHRFLGLIRESQGGAGVVARPAAESGGRTRSASTP